MGVGVYSYLRERMLQNETNSSPVTETTSRGLGMNVGIAVRFPLCSLRRRTGLAHEINASTSINSAIYHKCIRTWLSFGNVDFCDLVYCCENTCKTKRQGTWNTHIRRVMN